MSGFLLPMSGPAVFARGAPAAKSAAVPDLAAQIAQIHQQAADLEEAATDYTYDYSDWGETREEIEAELAPARDILRECQDVHAATLRLQAATQAAYDAANELDGQANDIADLSLEIERLTDSVAQLEARLASVA